MVRERCLYPSGGLCMHLQKRIFFPLCRIDPRRQNGSTWWNRRAWTTWPSCLRWPTKRSRRTLSCVTKRTSFMYASVTLHAILRALLTKNSTDKHRQRVDFRQPLQNAPHLLRGCVGGLYWQESFGASPTHFLDWRGSLQSNEERQGEPMYHYQVFNCLP